MDQNIPDDNSFLTSNEMEVMSNRAFLLTKATVLDKTNFLLQQTLDKLTTVVDSGSAQFWPGINQQPGKISRGENYRLLPYQVLDYPAYFDHINICAFRTMFYWGSFFSSTLHLQGECLDAFREKLIANFKQLLNRDIYIAISESPWQYHYEQDNYVLLQPEHELIIRGGDFVKLSKKIPLSQYQQVPGFATDYFKFILSVIR